MDRKCKVLLGLSFSDSVIQAWLGIWWIKVFADLLTQQVVASEKIICNIIGIASMTLVATKIEKPRIGFVVLCIGLTYFSLLFLWISPGMYHVASSAVCALPMSLLCAFMNSVYAQNIPADVRHKFDNHRNLYSRIAKLMGATLAFFCIFRGVPYWVVWTTVWILLDIDTAVLLILTKRGFFKYE